MKLIIHVGVPKSATTTIQDEIFENIHLKEKVYFIGRSKGRSELDKDVMFYLLNENEKIEESVIKVKFKKQIDSIVNDYKPNSIIISEECFTSCFKNNGRVLDLQLVARKLSYLTADYKKILIFSMRSQLDAVFSYYVQIKSQSQKFKMNFKEFLADESMFSQYKYFTLSNYYKEEFPNVKMEFLLMEKARDNPQYFSKELARIIGFNDSINLKNKYSNTKKKTIHGYNAEKLKLKNIISDHLPRDNFIIKAISTIFRNKYLSFIKEIIFNISVKKGENVALPNQDELNYINDMFYIENISINTEYNLNLQNYSYPLVSRDVP